MFRFASHAVPILSLALVSFASAQGTDWVAEPVKKAPVDDALPVKTAPVAPDALEFRLVAGDKPGFAKIDVVATGEDLKFPMIALGVPVARAGDVLPILELDGDEAMCPFALIPAVALEGIDIEVGDADLAKLLLLAVAQDLDGKLVFSKVTPIGKLWDECFFYDSEYPTLEAATDAWDAAGGYELKIGVVDSREQGFLLPDEVFEGEKNEVFLTFHRRQVAERPEPIRDPHVVRIDLGPEAGKLTYVYLRVGKECGKSPYMLAAVTALSR